MVQEYFCVRDSHEVYTLKVNTLKVVISLNRNGVFNIYITCVLYSFTTHPTAHDIDILTTTQHIIVLAWQSPGIDQILCFFSLFLCLILSVRRDQVLDQQVDPSLGSYWVPRVPSIGLCSYI